MFTANVLKKMLNGIWLRLIHIFPLSLINKEFINRSTDWSLVMSDEDQLLKNSKLLAGVVFILFLILILNFLEGLVLVAGIFLSIGISQQIISVCLNTAADDLQLYVSRWTTIVDYLSQIHIDQHTVTSISDKAEWQDVNEHISQLYISPFITNDLPHGLDSPNSLDIILNFIDEYHDEFDYPVEINSESGQLAFSQHMVSYLHSKLLFHDRLNTLQAKSGGVDSILPIAIGTLIWLLSS